MALGALPPGQTGMWTLYDKDGKAAVPFDTFLGCTVKQEDKITQNPVEKGSFANYNRVASPGEIGVILARTGKPADLSAMLDALDKLTRGDAPQLVSVVTPEKTWLDYALASYDYDRKSEGGVDRLIVSLALQEVRQVEPRYSNENFPPIKKGQAQKAADADTVNAGKQQAQTPQVSTAEKLRRYAVGQS